MRRGRDGCDAHCVVAPACQGEGGHGCEDAERSEGDGEDEGGEGRWRRPLGDEDGGGGGEVRSREGREVGDDDVKARRCCCCVWRDGTDDDDDKAGGQGVRPSPRRRVWVDGQGG